MEMDYGYEEEENKSWLQKIIDYIKQKDLSAKSKLKKVE